MKNKRSANKYVPYVRAAFRVGQAAYNYYKSNKTGTKRASSVSLAKPIKRVKYSHAPRRVKRGVTGKPAGKIRKGTKSFKKDPVAVYMRKGVVKTQEINQNLNASQNVIIGHSTMIAIEHFRMACRAMIKSLFAMDTEIISNFEDLVTQQVPVQVRLDYYADSTTTTVSTAAIINIPSTYNYNNVASILWSTIVGLLNSGGSMIQLKALYLMRAQTIGTVQVFVNRVEVDLTSSVLHWWCKSDMKIQNRTVAASGTANHDSMANDAEPLYGKTYDGKGSGAVTKGNRETGYTPLFADENNGVIQQSGAVLGLQEPPSGIAFNYVSRQGKLSLSSGEIKTSILESKWSQPIGKYIMELARVGAGYQLGQRLYSKGKFRFVSLEKMINTDIANPIQLGYEMNNKYGCYVKFKTNKLTQMIFTTN